jgi:pimeloyl-ACP methyl ester carboxylesterase
MRSFWGPDWGVPTTRAEIDRYVPKTISYANRCAALSRRLLPHISTKDTVRDLDYLRHLVGDRGLNYRGESYGTFIGQVYANMFPRRVRAMVLDSVIDPVPYVRSVQAAILSNEADSDLVFRKFQSLCQQAGPSRCALAGNGPVAARVSALLTRLRQGPIPAPSAPAPHLLTYGDALTALWLTLGTPATWKDLAQELDQAADGDGSALENRVAPNKPVFQESLVPATALQCADKRPPPPGEIQRWPAVIGGLSRNNLVAPVDGWFLWAPCASWRIPSADRYTGPWNRTTPNPILVLGQRFDPRTQYGNARTAARRLGNAVLLTNNGYGHTTSTDVSTCTIDATTRYLTTLRTPRRGTVCQPDHSPFDPDFGR